MYTYIVFSKTTYILWMVSGLLGIIALGYWCYKRIKRTEARGKQDAGKCVCMHECLGPITCIQQWNTHEVECSNRNITAV